MATRIPVLSRQRARSCGRCGAAVNDDGLCAGCVALEQARTAFIIPRPSQLGHRSAQVASIALDDVRPLIPERHLPLENVPPTSGLRGRLAAIRRQSDDTTAPLEMTPAGSAASRDDSIADRLGAIHPVAAADVSPTASEYRAILAAHSRTRAIPDGGGSAASVIRTPALRQPSPAREATEVAAVTVVRPAPRSRRKKATAPEARTAKTPTAPRERRPTTTAKRESVTDSSATQAEPTGHRAPDSHRIFATWAAGLDAEPARRRGMWRRAVWVIIVASSALVGAAVPILLMR